MSDHPMQPSDDQIQQWIRAGAAAQLDACCEWLCSDGFDSTLADRLLAAMRPKPPALAEQAEQELAALRIDVKHLGYNFRAPAITAALQRLAELEAAADG